MNPFGAAAARRQFHIMARGGTEALEYTREDTVVELRALVGRSQFAVDAAMGAYSEAMATDFIFLASDLRELGAPAPEDLIVRKRDKAVFKVVVPAFGYMDPSETMVRVHTQRLKGIAMAEGVKFPPGGKPGQILALDGRGRASWIDPPASDVGDVAVDECVWVVTEGGDIHPRLVVDGED